ncbi:MAG: hypothetical protein VCA55_04185 [Verrucomicrobiales bacterium]
MPGNTSRKRTAIILTVIFLVALVMGPGPGSLLIAPPGSDPPFWFGMPALYLWAILWFFIEAAVIIIAARTLWRKERD